MQTVKIGETEILLMQCGTCGVWHGLPKIMFDNCREEGGFWHCPSGHSRGWKEGAQEREAIRRERDLLKQQAAQKDDEIRRLKADKLTAERKADENAAKAVRARKRAAAGVCQCCNRSFVKLAQHMATKHPTFKAELIQ